MRKIILLMLFTASIFTSCSDDDSNTNDGSIEAVLPKEYKVQMYGESSSEVAYPLIVTYYRDDEAGLLIAEEIISETNTDVVESNNLTSYDKIGFKITVGNQGYATINHIVITDVETNEILFEEYINMNVEETFIYDISDEEYTIQ